MIQASFPPTVMAAFVQCKWSMSLANTIKVFKGVIKTDTTMKTIIAVITPVKDFLPLTKAILAAINIPI